MDIHLAMTLRRLCPFSPYHSQELREAFVKTDQQIVEMCTPIKDWSGSTTVVSG